MFDNGDGGSGQAFDWRLVAKHAELNRAIVAGGINPANARAAQGLGGYAIDVGSAVETSPGIKSAEKIRALFAALRPQSRQALRACA